MKGTEVWDNGNTINGDGWGSNQMWRRIHQDAILSDFMVEYFTNSVRFFYFSFVV